jgi:hypothetical protein
MMRQWMYEVSYAGWRIRRSLVLPFLIHFYFHPEPPPLNSCLQLPANTALLRPLGLVPVCIAMTTASQSFPRAPSHPVNQMDFSAVIDLSPRASSRLAVRHKSRRGRADCYHTLCGDCDPLTAA